MLITCPSCGRSHDSAKYRGAFEIECDCGYSILVPDEEALSVDNANSPGFQAPPIAMDEEDSSMAIDISDATNVASVEEPENPFAPFDGATDMTPEGELPTGMIYDPDEAQALANSKDAWSESKASEATFLDPFEPIVESLDDGGHVAMNVSDTPNIPDLPETQSPAQIMLQQNQSASLGHLVGSFYDVTFVKLEESQLLKMSAKCEELLITNPWIKQILEENVSKCAPVDFVNHKKITRVPEVLALELFLFCHEIGGSCSFVATESLELHAP